MEMLCNNDRVIAHVRRTHLEFVSIFTGIKTKLSFFDIKSITFKNGILLCRTTEVLPLKVTLQGNRVGAMQQKIKESLRAFYLDFRIGELVSDAENDDVCPICLNLPGDNSKLRWVRLPCCNKVMHADCFKNTLKHYHTRCPMCRSAMCPFCQELDCVERKQGFTMLFELH
jgi:hypothetical protein